MTIYTNKREFNQYPPYCYGNSRNRTNKEEPIPAEMKDEIRERIIQFVSGIGPKPDYNHQKDLVLFI